MKRLPAGLRFAGRRLNRSQRRRPRLYYDPSPALRGFRASTIRRWCVLAANRVGKTQHAAHKLAQYMVDHPECRVRLVGPTNKSVARTHSRYMYEFLQDHLVPGCTYRPGKGFPDGLIRLTNGATCECLSYQQDPEAHASSSLHVVWLDEPPPLWAYEEAVARVFDTGGSVWITLTAVGRPVKWLRKVVEQGVRDRLAGHGEGWEFVQVALTAANCPWYTEEQIAERVREVARNPTEYRQRIEGAWDGVSEGRKFVSFVDDNLVELTVHAADGWPKPGERIRLVASVDHGEGEGHSHWLVAGYQIVRRHRYGVDVYVRVLAEWTNERRLSAADEAREVRKVLRGLGTDWDRLDWVVGDVNTAGKAVTARTLNEVFEAAIARDLGAPLESPPVSFRPATKGPDSIRSGIALANQWFATTVRVRDGAEAYPSLSVSEACEGLVETLHHWTGEDDELKHAGDSLRYLLVELARDLGWEPVALAA